MRYLFVKSEKYLRRRWIMNRENIYNMKGFTKVFKFTLVQTFKNPAYRLSFILFVVIMTIMGPLQYFMSRNSMETARDSFDVNFDDTKLRNVYVINDTAVDFDFNMIIDSVKKANSEVEGYDLESKYVPEIDDKGMKVGNVHFIMTDKSYDEIKGELGKDSGVTVIKKVETGYEVSGIIDEDSEVETGEIDDAAGYIKTYFEEARLKDVDVSDADIKKITAGLDTDGVITESDYMAEQNKTITGDKYFTYILGFSVITMMIISMSNSFIIASVTEEKQSKLVESLLVSVRPMALLMGKICGMMGYVLSILACGFIGSKLSDFIISDIMKVEATQYSGAGFDFSVFSKFGPSGLIILLAALILGYLTFAVIGGIMGSSCCKVEDTQNATGTVMMIVMLGYMGAIFVGMSDKPILNTVLALVPPFSYFSAPIMYVSGRIGLGVLLGTFAIQIVILILLVLLCAKVYRTLILSDSSTPKISQIIKTLKQ